MNAYATLTNRRERVYLDQMLTFVPALDRAYMKDFYDKQAAEMEKQRKKSQQGAQRGGGINRPPPNKRR